MCIDPINHGDNLKLYVCLCVYVWGDSIIPNFSASSFSLYHSLSLCLSVSLLTLSPLFPLASSLLCMCPFIHTQGYILSIDTHTADVEPQTRVIQFVVTHFQGATHLSTNA